MTRVARAASATTLLFMVSETTGVQFVWKIYWFAQGNHLRDLQPTQWQFLLGYATPENMNELRNYPDGYRNFLQNAPSHMVPPWDFLQALAAGQINPSTENVRNAVNRLNPEQKATLRDRANVDKVRAILSHSGSTNEQFRTCTYLGFELNWSIYWLGQMGRLGSLSRQQWGQILSEAGETQWNALITWPEAWNIVQRECPAEVLQIVQARYNTSAAGTTSTEQAWNDNDQVNRMFDTLGPAGFLAQATSTDAAGVRTRFTKAKSVGKVMATLEGIEVGARLGETEKANLAKWWNQSGETDLNIMIKMCEVRFRVSLRSTWWQRRTSSGSLGSDWTLPALQRIWTTCERLPPAQVEGNNSMIAIIRDSSATIGSAYYGTVPVSGDGIVVAGQENLWGKSIGTTDNATGVVPTQAGGQGVDAAGNPSAQVNVDTFNATLRHEIGHAVDNQLNVMEGGWRSQTVAGEWRKYGSWGEFVDAIISDFGGLTAANGVPAGKRDTWRDAMLSTVRAAGAKTFRQALTAEDSSTTSLTDAQINKGPASAVWEGARWTDVAPLAGGSKGPWYNGLAPASNSQRVYQSAYQNDSSLWSYLKTIRDARMISQYQWRAPGEWFAECYQIYYAEQERGPNVPVGGLLRSRDPEAANMMSALVDQGYSPQEMRGDRAHTAQSTGTVNAPGTPRPRRP